MMGMKAIGPKDKEFLNVITSNADGSQSKDWCIIKAHGQQMAGKTFAMSGGELSFYCNDGDVLLGNFYKFLRGDVRTKSCKKYSNNDVVPNLTLSKSVDRHQSGGSSMEIYRVLANWPETGEDYAYTNYQYLEKLCIEGVSKFDIVSVKNRSWFVRSADVTLGEVYTTLKSHGYAYGEIHSYTCRAQKKNPPLWHLHEQRYVRRVT